jgi:preprotein translocase subunit SecG
MADFMMVLLLLISMLLIIVVLLQRGRGGGLAGAFGGLGGQSAFGTKAGDVFTKITIGLVTIWVILAGITGILARQADPDFKNSKDKEQQTSTEDGDEETSIGASGDEKDSDAEKSGDETDDSEKKAPDEPDGDEKGTEEKPAETESKESAE